MAERSVEVSRRVGIRSVERLAWTTIALSVITIALAFWSVVASVLLLILSNGR